MGISISNVFGYLRKKLWVFRMFGYFSKYLGIWDIFCLFFEKLSIFGKEKFFSTHFHLFPPCVRSCTGTWKSFLWHANAYAHVWHSSTDMETQNVRRHCQPHYWYFIPTGNRKKSKKSEKYLKSLQLKSIQPNSVFILNLYSQHTF